MCIKNSSWMVIDLISTCFLHNELYEVLCLKSVRLGMRYGSKFFLHSVHFFAYFCLIIVKCWMHIQVFKRSNLYHVPFSAFWSVRE